MNTVENNVNIAITQGEIKITFKEPISGKVTLEDIGLSDEDLSFEGGLIRMVFDFQPTNKERHFFSVPTIEIAYRENMGETHWICDYNKDTILDKMDHQGHSTVMLLSRNAIEENEHHHENRLVMHAEFPQAVHVLSKKSYFHFFN